MHRAGNASATDAGHEADRQHGGRYDQLSHRSSPFEFRGFCSHLRHRRVPPPVRARPFRLVLGNAHTRVHRSAISLSCVYSSTYGRPPLAPSQNYELSNSPYSRRLD
jgi:hypothetical protein